MKKEIWGAKRLVRIALAIAVVCVSTIAIQIPIPLGYMHLGNCCILLISVYEDKMTGALAGGIGSALADLISGYPQWIIPTLLIKGIMGYAISYIAGQDGTRARINSIRTFAAVFVGIMIMVVGYTLFGGLLYGNFVAGLAQIPGLSTEGVLGAILFYVLGNVFERGRIFKVQQQGE